MGSDPNFGVITFSIFEISGSFNSALSGTIDYNDADNVGKFFDRFCK